MTLDSFLTFAMTAGGVGTIVAFLLERFPGFEILKSDIKALIVFALSFIIPLIAMAVTTYTSPAWLAQAGPWFQMLVIGFTVWTGSQIAHGVDRKLNL